MSRIALCLTIATALASSGCMSIANHSPYFVRDEQKRGRVYGGVRGDVEIATQAVQSLARGEPSTPGELLSGVQVGLRLRVVRRPGPSTPGELLSGVQCVILPLFIDLPLCVIADTLYLPQDLQTQREREAKKGSEAEAEK